MVITIGHPTSGGVLIKILSAYSGEGGHDSFSTHIYISCFQVFVKHGCIDSSMRTIFKNTLYNNFSDLQGFYIPIAQHHAISLKRVKPFDKVYWKSRYQKFRLFSSLDIFATNR